MESTLTINRLFSKCMVLQREKPIKLWGTYEGTESVQVSFMGTTVEATKTGNDWTAMLPPMEAARDQILTVCAGQEKIEITNVHVGEVWLAGGQSNMEFYMRYDADFKETVQNCVNADIRFFDQPETCYEEQEQDFDYSRMGFWRTCDPENLEYFSAVAYYFAVKIWQELQVPVGIIGCNKGGSTTQAWMSKEALGEHGSVWLEESQKEIEQIDFNQYKEKMRKDPQMNWGDPFADLISDKLLYGLGADEQSGLMEEFQALPVPPIHFENMPECYYKNMLLKVAGVTVRGVIWYQGESEVFHVECYEDIFKDMIDNWRELWAEELPFYCVQLAPFQNWMACYGTEFPEIRQIQAKVAREKDGVYLVSTSDVGMRYDIHPKRKQPVGTRLALSALKNQYGLPVQADAPVCVAARAIGNDVHLEFQGDMDTLYVERTVIDELQLFGKDLGKERELSYDPADFQVDGRTLILKNANMGGRRVNRVAFAEKDYYKVNLYGSNGVPAMPFACEII